MFNNKNKDAKNKSNNSYIYYYIGPHRYEITELDNNDKLILIFKKKLTKKLSKQK